MKKKTPPRERKRLPHTLSPPQSGVKILLWDIETSPAIGKVWGMYEQNVIRVVQQPYMLAWSAKWLGSKQVMTRTLPDYPLYKKHPLSDESLVRELWSLINKADILVAHNGDQFDIKRAHTRFIFYGLTPPKPFKTVDTCKAARRYFGFMSNKLNDLLSFFGFPQKVEIHGNAWEQCEQGDMKAWRRMKKYNRYDTLALEKIYLRMRPYIKNHPNVGVYAEEMICPKCSSQNVKREGHDYSKTTVYQMYSCKDCGAWGRKNRGERKEVLV